MQTMTITPPVSKPNRRMEIVEALQKHWPEYLMEAAGLGIFMISACVFTVLLEHPASPLNQMIENGNIRRALIGIAMGATLIGIVYSPWGQRSGAHLNPVLSLSFLTLGKVNRWAAAFYGIAQFAGGIAGVAVSDLLLGFPLRHSSVNYAVTIPGPDGVWTAFAAEMLISFLMMSMVLFVSNSPRLTRLTPVIAGTLV